MRKFADKVIAAAPPAKGGKGAAEAEIKQALDAATAALDAGDLNRAAQIFGMVLQHAPDNVAGDPRHGKALPQGRRAR